MSATLRSLAPRVAALDIVVDAEKPTAELLRDEEAKRPNSPSDTRPNRDRSTGMECRSA